MGPREAEVKRHGRIDGLVFGACGEASSDVEQLVQKIAASSVQRHWRGMGARDVMEAKSILIARARKWLGVEAVRGHAMLKVDRLRQVPDSSGLSLGGPRVQDLRPDTVIAVRVTPSDSDEILLLLPDTQSNVMVLTPAAAERVRHVLTPLPEPMLVRFGPAELACPRYKFRWAAPSGLIEVTVTESALPLSGDGIIRANLFGRASIQLVDLTSEHRPVPSAKPSVAITVLDALGDLDLIFLLNLVRDPEEERAVVHAIEASKDQLAYNSHLRDAK